MKEVIAKHKLEELPDHLFDELIKDIYDEMDRRQIETSRTFLNHFKPYVCLQIIYYKYGNVQLVKAL